MPAKARKPAVQGPINDEERKRLKGYLVRQGFSSEAADQMLAMGDAGDSAEEEIPAGPEPERSAWEDPDAYRGEFRGAVSDRLIEETHALLQEHRRARGMAPWDFDRPNESLSKYNASGHRNGGLRSAAAVKRFRMTRRRTAAARHESIREFMVNVADKLRHSRHARGWSPKQVAEYLGMHPVNVRQIEAGKRKTLAPETVAKLKNFFEEKLLSEIDSGSAKAAD